MNVGKFTLTVYANIDSWIVRVRFDIVLITILKNLIYILTNNIKLISIESAEFEEKKRLDYKLKL